MTWAGYRDPARRRKAAAGWPPPPLPLDEPEARQRALELRARGLSYEALAVVMGVYHGQWATSDAWRDRCGRVERLMTGQQLEAAA